MNYKKFPATYLEINGTKYYGYELFELLTSREAMNTKKQYFGDVTLIDNTTLDKLTNNINCLLDTTFIPPTGSIIHTVPPCKFPAVEIRKNYKIKRIADEGICNVFGPAPDSYDWRDSVCANTLYIDTINRKILAIYTQEWDGKTRFSSTEIDTAIAEVFHNTSRTHLIIVTKEKNTVSFSFLPLKISEDYEKLLSGKLKKPCIPYENLDTNTGLDMTIDALELANVACRAEKSNEAEKNCINMLHMLAQHNYRDYRGCCDLVVNHMNNRGSVVWDMREHRSRYDKTIKDIFGENRFGHHEKLKFSSDRDFALCQEFVKNKLGLGERQFVSFLDIKEHCRKIDLRLEDFFSLFMDTIKISPRKYIPTKNNEEESKD